MTIRQIILDGRITEEKGRQFVSGQGLYNDGFTKILRIEPWGYASVPVAGSRGIAVPLGGNADMAVFLGGESGGHRPPGLPAGASALYDANGNIIKCVGTGIVIDVAGRTIDITAGQWTLTGNATITGNVTIDGNLTCTGNGTFAGSVTDGDGDGGA
ncbi:phage baseplate assembly protein V [uncultured Martelella sp.]|uniref:phage baseplate assembly protein V n=1 Tax=uncultured Martelella sp. TaxID=392331 RepID=UPI0029C6687B|nr:phage baseplate assembly protein V [uncultured Martelella sp.]